jgi:hypothetical protein
MKNRLGKGSILFLLLTVGLLTSISFVQASSETMPLVASASVSRTVYANQGDRIVGDFTVNNMPTWTDSYSGDPTTVQYTFKIAKLESPVDITVFEAKQQAQASFDVLCGQTGNYILRFNVGSAPASGLGNAQATLNYQVIAPTPIPTSAPNQGNELFTGINTSYIVGLVTFVLIAVVVVGIYSLAKSKKQKTQTDTLPPPPP